MYGYRCEKCGAYLDPGESCDCEEEEERSRIQIMKRSADLFVLEEGSDQFRINLTGGVLV